MNIKIKITPPRVEKIFDNSIVSTNGEEWFYHQIKPLIHTIFDVGSSDNSLFVDFEGEVHYFDPDLMTIKALEPKNPIYFLNAFGLGKVEKTSFYYPAFTSFYDRVASVGYSDDCHKINLPIQTGEKYIKEKQISQIDFLKIDTEGSELDVLMGFGEELNRVKIIQFEYGGTYMDNGVELKNVFQYLSSFQFTDFFYIAPYELVKIINPLEIKDHYKYCNIVCIRNQDVVYSF